MTLFERVKTTAKNNGFSIAEVARRAGIGEKSIYTWKPSKTYPNGVKPSREVLEKVSAVLNVSVDYLLGNPETLSRSDEPKQIDLKEAIDNEEIIKTYDGKPIPPEDLALIKRLMRGE
ncbi:helix-turn-helix domain-containing protein [Levilactobacillus humaensis]|uniref:helix-turn-helix domain-containing protein n=1 Tax=Levilactobacillus humaensis TaxID=2950375 RepID=UPI0021C44E3F|nr:helix-turn-helix transcriptional regulator [Levilactobacillus humaensis]